VPRLPDADAAVRRRAVILAQLGAACAAAMVLVAHRASEVWDWRILVFARAATAAIATFVLLRAAGLRPTLRAPRMLWVRSLVGAVGLVANFYVYAELPPADAVVLVSTSPLWLAVLSWLIYGQRPRAGVWVAILVGFAGIVIVERPQFARHDVAAFVAAASGLLMAIVMLAVARLRHQDPRAVVMHFSAVAAAVSLVFLAAPPAVAVPAAVSAGSVALLAAVCGLALVSQLASTRAFQIGRAPGVSASALSQVGIAFVADHLLSGRPIDAAGALGTALVTFPVGFLLLRPREPSLVVSQLLPPRSGAAAAGLEALVARVREAHRATGCHIELGDSDRGGAGVRLILAESPPRIVCVAHGSVADLLPRRAIARALNASLEAARSGADWERPANVAFDELTRVLALYFPPGAG
jgi:drug/metabolite transporter (DMT)-like permease